MTSAPRTKGGWAWACLTCDGISEETWTTAVFERRIPPGITWRPSADGRAATKEAYTHRRRAPHKRNAAIVISGPRGMQVEAALRRAPIPEILPPRKPYLSVEERLTNLEKLVIDLAQVVTGMNPEHYHPPPPDPTDPSYH